MNKNFKVLIEKDAVPSSSKTLELVSTTEESEILDYNDNEEHSVTTVNNNMLTAQTNSSTVTTSNVMNFNKCNGINVGTVVHIGWSPGCSKAAAKPKNSVVPIDETVYKKTPTIKAMLESKDPISPGFLDEVSGNFGFRWREITILLEISQLFVDRMYEDYNERGGKREVILTASH